MDALIPLNPANNILLACRLLASARAALDALRNSISDEDEAASAVSVDNATSAVRDAIAALNATDPSTAASLSAEQQQRLADALAGLEGILAGLPLGESGEAALDSVGQMQDIVANYSRDAALDAAAIMPEQLCLDVPNLPYLGVVFLRCVVVLHPAPLHPPSREKHHRHTTPN